MNDSEPRTKPKFYNYGAAFKNPDAMADRLAFWLRHPRHAYNAGLAYLFIRNHPDCPIITREAVRVLDGMKMQDWAYFEWGSGRSTIYFALRAKSVVSVEHSQFWFDKVTKEMESRNLKNVKISLLEGEEDSKSTVYEDHILGFPDESFDCVLVDGNRRNQCIVRCIPKLKPGGILILDDSERDYDIGPISDWQCTVTSDGIKGTKIFRKPGRT